MGIRNGEKVLSLFGLRVVVFNILSIALLSLATMPDLFSQVPSPENDIFETRFNTVEQQDLVIYYKGRLFGLRDSFSAVSKKISDGAYYSGKFSKYHDRIDEWYNDKSDYKILFDDDYFFFQKGKLAYFIIRSEKFTVKLRNAHIKEGVIHLKVGKSINVMRKGFQKSYAQKLTKGDADNDSFIINIGELKADSPIANNLIINVEKGGDRIKAINFYGY